MNPPMNMLVERRTVNTASTSLLPVSKAALPAFFIHFGTAFAKKAKSATQRAADIKLLLTKMQCTQDVRHESRLYIDIALL